jgi:Holliday junction resolvase
VITQVGRILNLLRRGPEQVRESGKTPDTIGVWQDCNLNRSCKLCKTRQVAITLEETVRLADFSNTEIVQAFFAKSLISMEG